MQNIKQHEELIKAQLTFLEELYKGHKSGEEEGWISSADVKKHFENKYLSK